MGFRERDRGLGLAVQVAQSPGGWRMPSAGSRRPLRRRAGEPPAEVVQCPGLPGPGSGHAGAVHRDPVRGDAVGPVVAPPEQLEQRGGQPPGEPRAARPPAACRMAAIRFACSRSYQARASCAEPGGGPGGRRVVVRGCGSGAGTAGPRPPWRSPGTTGAAGSPPRPCFAASPRPAPAQRRTGAAGHAADTSPVLVIPAGSRRRVPPARRPGLLPVRRSAPPPRAG